MARQTSFTFYRDVNLNMQTNDTFYFDNRTAQASYFSSKAVVTCNNLYYQRTNAGKVKVQVAYSTLYRCDYLSFINADYENKRFYAFITSVNYIDDDTTEVTYVIDHVQTWLLDLTFRPCYIERQHAHRDHVGDNILPDSVECGELVNKLVSDSFVTTRMLCVVEATFDIAHWLTSVDGNNQNTWEKIAPSTFNKQGVYDNVSQVAFVTEAGGSYAMTGSGLQVFINALFDGMGGATLEDIINIYLYPYIGMLLDEPGETIPTATSATALFNKVFYVGGAKSEEVNLPDNPAYAQSADDRKLDGYTPKNKKLYTYPYTVLHITNNDGSAIDLKYEKFKDASGNIIEHPKALICGTSCGEGKIRLTPSQYLGNGLNVYDFDTSIDSGAFPTCSMLGDAYNIYLAQNKNRIENQYNMMLFNSGMSIAGGAAADIKKVSNIYAGGALGGAEGAAESAMGSAKGGSGLQQSALNVATNLFTQIQGLSAQYNDLKIAPGTATGISGAGLAYQNGKKSFTAVVKTLDYVHAQMIDDYFTMFGYPMRCIDHPRLKARTAFTYIKTVGCIAVGNVPEEAKSIIQSMFDSGIRLWYDTANIGNYNVVNDPISS